VVEHLSKALDKIHTTKRLKKKEEEEAPSAIPTSSP
jgi:hypothetical protein